MIVEVGLDVPEATVIVIEGAERFGLATLHQLRGRVGRGARPGFAYLVPSSGGGRPKASARSSGVRLLERETDGFRIAEADSLLRGPGDWCGVQAARLRRAAPDRQRARTGASSRRWTQAAGDDRSRSRLRSAAPTYFAALGRALTARFDPKDAV